MLVFLINDLIIVAGVCVCVCVCVQITRKLAGAAAGTAAWSFCCPGKYRNHAAIEAYPYSDS